MVSFYMNELQYIKDSIPRKKIFKKSYEGSGKNNFSLQFAHGITIENILYMLNWVFDFIIKIYIYIYIHGHVIKLSIGTGIAKG